jgi:hypothetical protein
MSGSCCSPSNILKFGGRLEYSLRRTQTHSDFNHADMQIYRARLRALGGC